MEASDVIIQSFYCPLGLKQYRSTHVQILDIKGEEIVFRFRDEFRAYRMQINELLEKYERLER